MRLYKDTLIDAAIVALNQLKQSDSLEELALTKLQVKHYNEMICAKLYEYPIDYLNEKMIYRILTGTFKEMQDRNNLVTEAYIKKYCHYFFQHLQNLRNKRVTNS